MSTNVNLEAAVGIMGFLCLCLLLLLACALLLYALVTRSYVWARLILLAGSLTVGLYLGLLLAFSLSSRERRLTFGEEKHFCEIDCHLAYSISEIRRAKTLGDAPQQATAEGIFYVVTVRTRFDEKTISSTRGDAPLIPNSRVATVFDEKGRAYTQSAEGTGALASSKAAGAPFNTPLRPGESYTTTLVFDLPPDIKSPLLLINEGEWVTHLVVGHENSPLHRKTLFRLDPQGESVLTDAGHELFTERLIRGERSAQRHD